MQQDIIIDKQKVFNVIFESCWRLVVYFMLLGSSCPYPRLILKENGLLDDDDDEGP